MSWRHDLDPWNLPGGGALARPLPLPSVPMTCCPICSPDADAPRHLSTVVELWIGSAAYVHCVADVFTRDVLTITPLAGDAPLATWQPGQWVSAITYDAQGYPVATYHAQTKPNRYLTDDELLAQETR